MFGQGSHRVSALVASWAAEPWELRPCVDSRYHPFPLSRDFVFTKEARYGQGTAKHNTQKATQTERLVYTHVLLEPRRVVVRLPLKRTTKVWKHPQAPSDQRLLIFFFLLTFLGKYSPATTTVRHRLSVLKCPSLRYVMLLLPSLLLVKQWNIYFNLQHNKSTSPALQRLTTAPVVKPTWIFSLFSQSRPPWGRRSLGFTFHNQTIKKDVGTSAVALLKHSYCVAAETTASGCNG